MKKRMKKCGEIMSPKLMLYTILELLKDVVIKHIQN